MFIHPLLKRKRIWRKLPWPLGVQNVHNPWIKAISRGYNYPFIAIYSFPSPEGLFSSCRHRAGRNYGLRFRKVPPKKLRIEKDGWSMVMTHDSDWDFLVCRDCPCNLFNQLQFFVAKKVGKIVFCTFGMLETSWSFFFCVGVVSSAWSRWIIAVAFF